MPQSRDQHSPGPPELVDPAFMPDAAASLVTDRLTPPSLGTPFLNQFPDLGVPFDGYHVPA